MKFLVAGWLLAFLGVVTIVITAVVTAIASLHAHDFVWGPGQTTWGIVGAAAVVLGVVLFVVNIFRAMNE